MVVGASPLEDASTRRGSNLQSFMNAESYKIGDLATRFGAQLQGDATTLVTGVASITAAREGDLVFASDEAKFRQAMESRATAIVTGRFANTTRRDKPF